MKTVAELIEFLKTQPQDLHVGMLYDCMGETLYVTRDDDRLWFTHDVWAGDAVLFESERED